MTLDTDAFYSLFGTYLIDKLVLYACFPTNIDIVILLF